ncbi:MAG: CDP-archaeol synthase [Oscillospiraceae bacterium]|nr:CDP-archaeol synthase [Oscillospiraceae bacterium]
MNLLKFIGHIYVLILPVIMGGVSNMIFMKLPILLSWRFPMDARKTFRGKRVFGDNKTWKGFAGMIVFTALSGMLFWSVFDPSKLLFNLLRGAWIGFAYVLFELPNSFIKRRLDISSGKNGGLLQTFFDQSDSVFGIVLLYPLVYPLSLKEALGILVILTTTHYLINILLFHLKLKNQRG